MAFIKDIIIAIKTAAPKLENAKFCSPTKYEVIFKIPPLIIKLNKPRVINVIGNDNKCNIGFTNIFKSDRTKLAAIAIVKLAT